MSDQQKPAGHRVIQNGHPPRGTTKMAYLGPGGRPGNQPPKKTGGPGAGTAIDGA
jgi:hypothetical protein